MKIIFIALIVCMGACLPAPAQDDASSGINSQDYDLFQGTHEQLQDSYANGDIGPEFNYDPSTDPPPSTYDPNADIPPREIELEYPQEVK